MAGVSTSVSNWDFFQQHVQGGMLEGEFLSAAYTLIAAGPPKLSHLGSAAAVAAAVMGEGSLADQVAFPIGIIQNFNVAHNRQFARIFEIGSERSYYIAGRTIGQITLGRVLYHGPSILRVLYAYYRTTNNQAMLQSISSSIGSRHETKIPPGFSNFYINLASDLFSQPIGLMLYIKDINEKTYGVVYFEECYVPNHTLATDAQGVIMQESVALQFERAVPIAVQSISLITGVYGATE